MNHLTIDHLEQYAYEPRKQRKFWDFFHEIKMFALFLGIAFMGVTIFTNANVFMASLTDTLNISSNTEGFDIKTFFKRNNSISNMVDHQANQEAAVNAIIAQYSGTLDSQTEIAKDPNQLLSENIKGYEFNFNTLPPSNRLIVPRFAVNDPIIVSEYTNMNDFIYKNYNADLEKGVVSYPTTPEPGTSGTALIFGHTSQEWWKYNKYGMAFAHLAEMDKGDSIQVVRNGTLYEYNVVDIQVQYPDHVSKAYDEYAKKTDHNYLMLMGCYPIGTSKQRMLVIAQQVNN